MRTRFLPIAKWMLFVWGSFCLVGALVITGLTVYQLGVGNRNRTDSASTHDVRFVLNWCELGDQRIDRVLHSYVSSRSLTGDYLDAYAIKISHVDIAELTNKDGEIDNVGGRWYRGDQLPQIVGDAVGFAGGWLHEIPWFPTEGQLRSSEFYVYPWSIYCHGVHPTAVELIFIRPADKMVFYLGSKT